MLGVLHHHEDVFGCFDDFIQLGDGSVPDHLEDVQLAGDSLNIGDILYFILLKDLDGDGLLSGEMGGFFDFSEGALPNGQPGLPQTYSMR